MINNIDPDKAVVNRGNWYRLKKLFRKAEDKERLTIGFIGGSVTQGSLASAPEACYAYRVFEWWQKKFPNRELTYVNAGVGGTDSQFGVARVQSDLLVYRPDFVIVEFSINDGENEHFLETFEGLIRKILYSDNEPAVLILNNVKYDDGSNAEGRHNVIGKEYEVPCISMKRGIYPWVENGIIQKSRITPDGLHPNDEGHGLIAHSITCFLEAVYDKRFETEQRCFITRPPVTKNTFQNSVRYQNDNIVYTGEGFVPDQSKKDFVSQFFKKGWTADEQDAYIVFQIEAAGIAVQYRKTIRHPAPKAIAVIDDDWENAALLDGDFDEDWGDCLFLQTILHHTQKRLHKVEIRICEMPPNSRLPFYLVSVIGSY